MGDLRIGTSFVELSGGWAPWIDWQRDVLPLSLWVRGDGLADALVQ